jgi:hypothetical protein
MASIHRLSILSIAFACGCATDSPGAPDPNALLPGFELPPAPSADVGMRFITPPTYGLEPGSSHEICAWTGVKVDHQMDIRKANGYQLNGGHHIILFASKLNLPAGTSRECTDQDMASFRQIAATGAEGLPSEAPGELVYRIDPDMYIVLQEHYINAGDTTIDSQSALDITFAEPGKSYTPSHSIAFLNTNLDLKPGPNSLDVHCAMQTDVNGWFSLPHMHEWGTKFNASITHDGVVSPMFDELVWTKEYMFSPPTKQWDITAPTQLHTGDTVDVHCEWNNTTPNDLHFGSEMCVFYLQTVDTQNIGNLDCDNGTWGAF